MTFHDTEVHLSVAYQGNGAFCNNLVSSGIFKEEFLLIDGSGSQKRGIHAIEKPFWSKVTGIADFLDRLYPVTDALICAYDYLCVPLLRLLS